MAKIKVIGNAAVITSTLTLEDINLVQKYRPTALALMGGEEGKEEIFRIATTSNPYGNISTAGMMFGAENANGEAIITELVSPASDDIKNELADTYGAALVNLGKLEEILPGVVEEIKAEREALMANIEVQ